MSQELIFNELCVRHDTQRLNRTLDDAVQWLLQFSNLLLSLYRHKNISQLRVPTGFSSSLLINGHSIGRLLSQDASLIDKDHRDNIKGFADRGSAYLEDIANIFDEDGIFQYYGESYMFQHPATGEICRGLGAAHLLDALSVSIDVEEEFWDCESIEIEKQHNSGDTTVTVRHACRFEHLGIPPRTFERNPKHELVVEGGYVSRLDLTDQEAQSVLDSAIQAESTSARLWGYASRTNRIYCFPPHGNGLYHAYPVEIAQIPNRKQILRRLVDEQVIDDQIARRFR